MMSIESAGRKIPSFRDVLLEGRNDKSSWLMVPHEPCASDAHFAVSRATLYDRTCSIAAALARAGAQRGDRIVVIADNSWEASILLVATMAAGFVVVPVAPRSLGISLQRWSETVQRVCGHCQPRFIVGREGCLPHAPGFEAFPYIGFDSLAHLMEQDGALICASENELALIQYTSGTTERARGVELTHGNLLHNIAAVGSKIRVGPQDVGLTWLPLFHDMGLIGSLLAATHSSIPLVLMTPASFLLRPESWLWAISRFRVTCCAAPNSAYQLCCSRVPDRKIDSLDLSTWRVALNGAELVHAKTIEDFLARFSRRGFRSTAMYPVYGLAENTIATAFPDCEEPFKVDWVDRCTLERDGQAVLIGTRDERSARGIVSVGKALDGQELRVIDVDSGCVVPSRALGRIQVRGRGVMRGYHHDSERTSQTIDAEGWLDTGDLGYLASDELYVVGRSKELINRAGRKYDAPSVPTIVRQRPSERLLSKPSGARLA